MYGARRAAVKTAASGSRPVAPGGRSRALKSWGKSRGKSRENLQYNNFFRKYDFSLDRHDHISYMARTDT